LPAGEIIAAFNDGLGGSTPVALAYATLGAFAVMLSRTGITQRLSSRIIDTFQCGGHTQSHARMVTWGSSCRRLCYHVQYHRHVHDHADWFLGSIFLNDIPMSNINEVGQALDFQIGRDALPKAMIIPTMGMMLRLLVAIFISYRKNAPTRTLLSMDKCKPPLSGNLLNSKAGSWPL